MSSSTVTTRALNANSATPNSVTITTNLSILGTPSPNTSAKAISDDLDTTGMQKTSGTASAQLRVTMAPPAVAATTIYYSVTPRVRITGAGTVTLNVFDARTLLALGSADTITTVAGTANYSGSARTVNANGLALTAADVSAMAVDVQLAASGTPQIIEVYLDVAVNQPPTVTISSPSGTIRDSVRPLVIFNYADTESDAQERIRVKVFTQTQAATPGFDAETGIATFDSGEVFSTSSTYKPTADIPAGNYYVYMKVADAGSGGRYGPWAQSSPFTLSPDPPKTPSVTAAVDDTNGRVTLTVQGYDNELTYGQSSFESGVALNAASWVATNATLAGNTTTFLSGGESLQATYTNTQTPTIRSHSATGTAYAPPAVLPGLLYVARVSIRANAGSTARPWTPAIEWLNTAGTVVAVTPGPAVTDSTSAWTEAVVYGVAPAGAAQALLRLTSTQPAATEVHLFDQAGISPTPQLLTLDEASFETSVSGWSALYANTTRARSTAQALYGSASMLVTPTAGDTNAAVNLTRTGLTGVPILAGHTYTFVGSYYANTGGTSPTGQFQILWFDSAGSQVAGTVTGAQIPVTVGAWTTISLTGTAPANAVFASLNAYWIPNVTGITAYLDGFGLFERVNMLPANTENIEVDATAWVQVSNCSVSRVTTQALAGAASLQLSSTAAGTMTAATAATGTTARPVTPGNTYTATAAFRSAANARAVSVGIDWYGPTGIDLGATFGSTVNDTTTGWTLASYTAVAPAGAAFAGVQVRVASTAAAAEIHYVDVVELVDITTAPAWVHGNEPWTRGGMVGGVNLLTANAASIETDTSGWTAGTNTTLTKLALGTSGAMDGSSVLGITTTVNGTTATATSALVPITAGVLYTAGAMFSTNAGRSGTVTIQWFKADGTASAVRASDASPTSVVATYSLYRQLIVAAVAPSDAAYARVQLSMGSLQTTDGVNYVDTVFLHAGNSEVWRPGGGTIPVSSVLIERSVDGGATWSTVRAGQAVRLGFPGQQATVYDYDAPRDTTAIYRARTLGGTIPTVNGSTNPDYSVLGDWAATTTSPNDTAPSLSLPALCDLAWLKSSTDPTKNIQVRLIKDTANSASTEDQAVFEPQGRATPIIHGGTVRAEVFDALSFVFLNDAQYDAFETLRARQEPVLLQSPYGDNVQDQWWLRLGPTRQVIRYTHDGMATAQARRVTVAAREVAAPTT